MKDKLATARADLREWLTDLNALKPWTDDASNEVRREFTEAFDAAFARAKKAAQTYLDAIKGSVE